MLRTRAAMVLVGGLALVVFGLAGGNQSADAGLTTPTTTVETAPDSAGGESTTVAVPGETVPRGSARTANLVKPEDEEWTLRRTLTTVGLAVVALAAFGFVYGRIRSTPPRHPGLVRSLD